MESIKRCFAPSCRNNSLKNSDKIFVSVPEILSKRKRWFEAIGMENVPKGHNYYCCEDHFDLKEDSKNWLQWSFMPKSTRLMLKSNVTPHKRLIPAIEEIVPASEEERPIIILKPFFDENEDIIKTEPFDDSISSPLEIEYSDIIKTETFNGSINSPIENVYTENCDIEGTLLKPSNVRYVDDLAVEHFSTPSQAKQNLELVFTTIEKQRKKIKNLNQHNRKLEKNLHSLKNLVQNLHKDGLLSDETSSALMNIIKSK